MMGDHMERQRRRMMGRDPEFDRFTEGIERDIDRGRRLVFMLAPVFALVGLGLVGVVIWAVIALVSALTD